MKRQKVFSAKNISIGYKVKTGFMKTRKEWIFEDLSFDLYKGESLAIIGRNGAGKSTLMKIVAGIIEEDKGVVERSFSNASLLSLQAGFIMALSGEENIYLSAVLLGMSRKEIKNKLDEIIDYADIRRSIHKPVSTYSSGMKARLGFAIAIYSKPEIVLIDEVLGVGDDEFKEKSSAAIRGMIKSDQTVVFVSHNPQVVKELCDRSIWIENGRIVMDSTPEDVLEKYKRFTMICTLVAKDSGRTISDVRFHENNIDPLKTIQRFDELDKKNAS
jgi:lipopolysaccharide transport system ATP-binding protein